VADIWDIDKRKCTWVMKTASIKSRWRMMASWYLAEAGGSSQEGRRRREAWLRSDTRQHRGFVGFVLKTIGGFGGFSLKTIGGRFADLDLQTRRGRFGGLGIKTIGGGFDRFGPQNRGVADRRTCGGISKLALRRSEVKSAPSLLDRRRKTWVVLPLGAVWIPLFWRNLNILNRVGYLAWNLRFHNFPKFTYKFISNL